MANGEWAAGDDVAAGRTSLERRPSHPRRREGRSGRLPVEPEPADRPRRTRWSSRRSPVAGRRWATPW